MHVIVLLKYPCRIIFDADRERSLYILSSAYSPHCHCKTLAVSTLRLVNRSDTPLCKEKHLEWKKPFISKGSRIQVCVDVSELCLLNKYPWHKDNIQKH